MTGSGEVSSAALESSFLVDPKLALADGLGRLREFVELGLVDVDDACIAVPPKRRFVVLPIAMVSDRCLRSAQQRASSSRSI